MNGRSAMVSQNPDLVGGLQHLLQTPRIPSVAPPLDLQTLSSVVDVGQGGYTRVGYAPFRTAGVTNDGVTAEIDLGPDDTEDAYDEQQVRVIQALVLSSFGATQPDVFMVVNNGTGGTVCDVFRAPMTAMAVTGFVFVMDRPIFVDRNFLVHFSITTGGVGSTCFVRGYALQGPRAVQIPSI